MKDEGGMTTDYADSADLRGWGLWGLVAILILNTYFKTLKKFCGHQRDLRYLREIII